MFNHMVGRLSFNQLDIFTISTQVGSFDKKGNWVVSFNWNYYLEGDDKY